MWELDHKEGWAAKNWCFWIVVLEKTLESPLDCKETQPVHPEENQPRIFIGRTEAETEVPIVWPDAKSHKKRPWCRERLKAGGEGDNRRQDSWMASQTQWAWVWASSRRWWRTGKPGELQSMGHKELDVTEQLNNHKSLTKCPFSSDLGYELLHYHFMFATILWSCLSTLTWQWRNISWLQPPNK